MMEEKKEITVFLPAYKEAENLKILLPEISEILAESGVAYEILVVDTMESMDDTKEVCKSAGVRYINRRNGNSYGDAVRTGIEEARGDFIVTMDADGSHEPESILNLYWEAVASGVDMVIGSRYCKGGYTHNGFVLRSMSAILNLTYRLLFRLKVRDVSDSYRIYKAARLKSISLECNNFDILEEILVRMNYRYPDFKVTEIPINFQRRKYGTSKRNLVKFVFSYLVTIKRLLQIKRQEQESCAKR